MTARFFIYLVVFLLVFVTVLTVVLVLLVLLVFVLIFVLIHEDHPTFMAIICQKGRFIPKSRTKFLSSITILLLCYYVLNTVFWVCLPSLSQKTDSIFVPSTVRPQPR